MSAPKCLEGLKEGSLDIQVWFWGLGKTWRLSRSFAGEHPGVQRGLKGSRGT